MAEWLGQLHIENTGAYRSYYRRGWYQLLPDPVDSLQYTAVSWGHSSGSSSVTTDVWWATIDLTMAEGDAGGAGVRLITGRKAYPSRARLIWGQLTHVRPAHTTVSWLLRSGTKRTFLSRAAESSLGPLTLAPLLNISIFGDMPL